MIKVTNITRSSKLLTALNENDTQYAYMDDPHERYVFWAGLYNKGLGYLRIFFSDDNNVSIGYGDALIGHQDTIRTLINRARSHYVEFEEALDLAEAIELDRSPYL